MSSPYIARFRKADKKEQPLLEHLLGVQVITEELGAKLNIKHITGLAGLLHDLGKYSNAFQGYIHKLKNDDSTAPKRGSVDHASAGGFLLFERYYDNPSLQISNVLIESISNAIFSHHDKLKDMLRAGEDSPFWNRKNKAKDEADYETSKSRFFEEVMSEAALDDYVRRANEEFQSLIEKMEQIKLQYASLNRKYWLETMLTKYIFGVLIEADWTNSRIFDEEKEEIKYDTQSTFNKYEKNLEKYLQGLKGESEINTLRRKMSQQCLNYATMPPGIYTLSIPTGGGKTLASLRFALKHAQQEQKKERIFYFVPFTTIIEQNVKTVKKALQTEGILEHHSNVVESKKDPDATGELDEAWDIKLLKETWKAPIIFTTIVQFLNVFYTGEKRDARRLHTLANSVIIFDEVQAVPIKCISLFNEALNFLTYFMNTTIILCTATQPALQHVKGKLLEVKGEMIDDLQEVTEAFRRTDIVSLVRPEGWNTSQLAELVQDKLSNLDNILIILNTKKVVKSLYDFLVKTKEYNVIHLSTSMCAAHRKKIMENMFKCKKKKTICISTQLIEAGVDISFQCVIRSLAGLDSVAQAAGRCNRNGEVDSRDVYIINHSEENLRNLKTIERGANIMSTLLKFFSKSPESYGGHLLSPTALDIYFQNYYKDLKAQLNFPITYSNIYDILFTENGKYAQFFRESLPFEMRASFSTAGREFSVISAQTKAILVPYGNGKELIAQLSGEKRIVDLNEFLRSSQPYIVNVYADVFHKLIHNRLIGVFKFGELELYYALEGAYSDKYGLDDDGEAALQLYSY